MARVKLILLDRIIVRPGFNVRRRRRSVQWLVDSIRESGQIEPITLLRQTNDAGGREYALISGEGRVAALRELGRERARALIYANLSLLQQYVLNIAENRSDDVHFLDLAARWHEMHYTGAMPFDAIAKQTGYSYEHVTNACRVMHKVHASIVEAAYTLDTCPVAFLIKLAAVETHEKQIAEWDRRFGPGALERPPRKRISLAGVRRMARNAPPECRAGVDYILRHFGGTIE